MIVTINTDASFHPHFKVAAFAFWIVSNEGRISNSGSLRKKVHRPEQAEFKCIINAFHVLGKQGYKNINKIIVNTDCLNVIHLINDDKKAIRRYRLGSWGNNLVTELFMVKRHFKMQKIACEFRHVPSHVDTETKRNWVNDWCDRQAKYHLWKLINSQKE